MHPIISIFFVYKRGEFIQQTNEVLKRNSYKSTFFGLNPVSISKIYILESSHGVAHTGLDSQSIAESSKTNDFPGESSSPSTHINSEPVPSENKEVCELIDLDDAVLIHGERDIKGKDKEISSDFSTSVDNLSGFVNLDDPNFSLFTSRDKLLEKYSNAMKFHDFEHMEPDFELPFPCRSQAAPTPPNNNTTPTSSSLEIEELNDAISVPDLTLSNVEKHSMSETGRSLVKYLSSVNNANYLKPWNEPLLFETSVNNDATNVDTSPNNNIQTGLTGSSSLNKGSGGFPVHLEEILAMMDGSVFGSGPHDICDNLNLEPPPGPVVEQNMDEIMHNFDRFNKFDIVEDCSDHYYAAKDSLNQATRPKNWAKRIQEEWKILENNLPDAISVRVYESRMDLLRAVIVGAEGTPYHDGLFFFDIYFPASYPDSPPLVYYHSGGLRLNPNLYNNGKVCLSLFNTWSGETQEEWIPGVSTMLQVLVSIQGLILNAKPYFNEPGYAGLEGSEWGQKSSLRYNEKVFVLSMQTMVYSMNRPPKHFEAFVRGHFCMYAENILVSCDAYLEGAQVGCLVRDGAEGDKSSSLNFKYSLARFITTLIDAFTRIGAEDCNKFRPLAEKVRTIAPPPPPSPPPPLLVPVMPYYFP